MSDLKRAADVERLMHLLMHDLRSPLGVAQGYISLLGGSQLSAEDRVRALRGVTDAIARISGLVEDASTLLNHDEADMRQGLVESSLLCERVAASVERRGIHVTSREACGGARIRVGTSVDRLSEAITVVLSATDRARRGNTGQLTLGMSRDDTELRFTINRGSSAPDQPLELVAFDPGAIGSVEHLKAHWHISLLHGHVWREVGESRACGVTLPLSP